MSGYAVSLLGTGRYGTEKNALYTPRKPDPNKRAIIYAHGANGDGSQTLSWDTQSALTRFYGEIACQGYVILSGDWGGPHTYGNDTELAAMEAGWAWLQTSGLCATDKVILTGASMGMLSTSRFAAEHPASVAGLNCWIPAIDIDALRNSNALGLRDLINAAWGLTAGSYPATGGAPVPARGQPIERASEVEDIPTHLWYSSGDTVTLAADVLEYAASRTGVTLHEVSTTLDHSNSAIAASNIDAIIEFFHSVA